MASLWDFFSTEPYPARWECGAWSAGMGWLHIVSDLAIFTAYTAIPISILIYVKRRGDVPFPLLFWLFCAFIFSCGTTHLLEAVIFWYPLYPVSGLVKAFTAIVSIATVIVALRFMPQAVALPQLAVVNKELAESRRRLVAAQSAARIGDWSYEPVSQRIQWSEEVFRLFERDPALGPPRDQRENDQLYTPSGRAALDAAMKRMLAEPAHPLEIELEVALPGGRTAWHRSTIQATTDHAGAIERLWGTVQDITAQKLAAADDDRRRRELEGINRQLEQFAYVASHDLLEPLRKVRYLAGVLDEEGGGRASPAAGEALEKLRATTDRMQRLVADLLEFARLGRTPDTGRPVLLDDALRDALDVLDTRIRESGAVIEREPLPRVFGDHVLLTQVLQNLIANALRYRDPARPCQVRIRARSEGRRVSIEVVDNGIGFPAEQAERLFEPFVRLHPEIDDGGTGIGLAICRRIIEAHGGSISAAAVPGTGALFTITLPLA